MHVDYVKSATQGMGEAEKAVFIHDYLVNSFQYGAESTPGSAVQGFKTGFTRCLGYTAAFYIIGLNCGLKVRAIPGAVEDVGLNTFSIVNVNGRDLVVDVTRDDSSQSNKYLLIPLSDYKSMTNMVIYRDSFFEDIV